MHSEKLYLHLCLQGILIKPVPGSEGQHDSIPCKIGHKIEGSLGHDINDHHQEDRQATPKCQKIQNTVLTHCSQQLM